MHRLCFPDSALNFFQSVKNFEKHFRTIKERTGKAPVFFRGLSREANDVHASVELAFAVNRNCRKKDTAFAFLKYILSEDQQIYYCGDREGSLMGGYGNISMPVNNKAFSHNLQLALTKYDDDGEEIGTYNDYSDLGKQYILLLQNINRVTLYSACSISPYYFYNVTDDIVYNYINGKISKDKLIQQLIAATETYLNE